MRAQREQPMRVLPEQPAPALWSFAVRRLTNDPVHAQDVVQETLPRARRRPDVLDQSARSARAWLDTVARRVVTDEWRTGRSRTEFTTDEPSQRNRADEADAARLAIPPGTVRPHCHFALRAPHPAQTGVSNG